MWCATFFWTENGRLKKTSPGTGAANACARGHTRPRVHQEARSWLHLLYCGLSQHRSVPLLSLSLARVDTQAPFPSTRLILHLSCIISESLQRNSQTLFSLPFTLLMLFFEVTNLAYRKKKKKKTKNHYAINVGLATHKLYVH